MAYVAAQNYSEARAVLQEAIEGFEATAQCSNLIESTAETTNSGGGNNQNCNQ